MELFCAVIGRKRSRGARPELFRECSFRKTKILPFTAVRHGTQGNLRYDILMADRLELKNLLFMDTVRQLEHRKNIISRRQQSFIVGNRF